MFKNNLRKILVPIVVVFSQVNSFGQDAAAVAIKPEVSKVPDMFFDPITYLWILLGAIILLTIYTMSHTITVLTRIVEGRPASEDEKIQESIQIAKRQSVFSKLMHALVRSVPIEKERDVLLDHDYDGIHELDNQLPPWWKYGFYITIVFAFVYLVNFHVSGSGKLQIAEYNDEMMKADLETKKRNESNTNNVTFESAKLLTDAAALSSGKDIFMNKCKVCHGDFAQGNVGPNLTDEFWIHGGGISNLFKTITDGVPAKGMISWKAQLTPIAIQEVASYILSLQGSNPVGAKPPQGDKWVAVVDTALKAGTSVVDSSKSVAQIK